MGSNILRRLVQGADQKWVGKTQATCLGPFAPQPSSLFISVPLSPLSPLSPLCV
jgi:hypothetical protein